MISVLVVGFNATIKLSIKGQAEEQKNKELEKEKLQTELAFLRNQVSPHFLMNTLNNIHALVDLNPEDAKESIVKLSRLMRYLLYDSENGKTKLVKEIEFIKSYVDLMKLRLVSNVDIQLSFPDEIPDVEIPPLLFISLVENAFKHGISYQAESYILIFLQIHEKHLFFRIKNSLHKKTKPREEGGIGLANLKKRMELIYGTDFSLSVTETENSFETNIKIPLHGN
jgi:LytS/YehU family sensor histidine kinase